MNSSRSSLMSFDGIRLAGSLVWLKIWVVMTAEEVWLLYKSCKLSSL